MTEPYSLFISDLHLSTNQPIITEQFLYFIRNIANSCERLYILGDLFELWLGEKLNSPLIQELRSALYHLKHNGTAIYFMRGNRDFLLSDTLIQSFYMQPLSDPTVISLYGKKWLLSHGDRLCTLDYTYQRYRRIANIKVLQWIFLHTPSRWRQSLAHKIHQKNPHKHNALNLEYKHADAVPETIMKELEHYQVNQMIHGHTHRIGIHWQNNNLRIVLGDWRENYFNYLYISKAQIILKSCPWPEIS